MAPPKRRLDGEPPRKRGRPSKADLAERERRREALALGGCARCGGCTRQHDCEQCVPCQNRANRIRASSDPNGGCSSSLLSSLDGEICIMRKCELLTEDSDVFKAIGDPRLTFLGAEDVHTSRPRKQQPHLRQTKPTLTEDEKEYLANLVGSNTNRRPTIPAILKRKRSMTVELGNTVPNSGQSSVLTDVRATSQETAPASGVSTINQSAITAAVQSGHPVLIVNSDQLSLLENSQEIVVMQGSDPKTLEVSVVRLNDESNSSAGAEVWMLGQNVEQAVEEGVSVEDFDGTIEYDEEEDGYDPHRVRAHITRGIGAFAATPSPNASAHEFLSPEQRHLLARKKGRSKLLSTPRQRKSRLFVVAEDGATIVITGAAITDRARAVEIADEKMPYVREKMAIIQNAANLGSAGGRQKGSGPSRIGQNKNLRLQHQKSQSRAEDIGPAPASAPHSGVKIEDAVAQPEVPPQKSSGNSNLVMALEDCTTDVADMGSMQKLPNQIQLVESDLPLAEAENVHYLLGNYLFRQMYSSQEPLRCLICKDEVVFSQLIDLEKHYQMTHDVQTVSVKAEFSDLAVFICLPDDVTEETVLKSTCQFCSATLRTLVEVRDHYMSRHQRCVRHIFEGQLANLSTSFYCSTCNFASATFDLHHEHMKTAHLSMTFVCRYCDYFTPRPGRLKVHVKQRHLHGQTGLNLQCVICSVYVHGRDRLLKHVLLSHAVQTGPTIWSCSMCLESTTGHDDLLDHMAKCPEHLKQTTNDDNKATTNGNELVRLEERDDTFKCSQCDQTFTRKEELDRHAIEAKCVPDDGDNDAEGLDERASTCFLCDLTFKNSELTAQHLHHVHMKWIKRTVRSADKAPEVATQLCPLNDATEVIMDPSAMLEQNEIPTDAQLKEMGFPEKVGHYCHLCNVVIKSYTLFYLHMHNLHGMLKRFTCVVSSCSNTFDDSAAFQIHAGIHDQRAEHFCAMCDLIFNTSDELQEHFMSPEHATQHMRVQDQYNRSEPHNYCCRVCHTWHGLMSTFVRHMETESHQYPCQHCGQMFVQPAPRRNHIRNVHPELAHICEICGTSAPSAQALWSHLSQHSVVHECSKCHRRFLQKEQLLAHMEAHAPPTPCPWEGCNRRLNTKVGLYNHLRLHRGECDFKCPICERGFFKKKYLDIHLKSHESPRTMPSGGGIPLLGSHGGLLKPRVNGGGSAPEVRLICAGCLKGFDSESDFKTHDCSSTSMPDQQRSDQSMSDTSEQINLNPSIEGQQQNVENSEDLAEFLSEGTAGGLLDTCQDNTVTIRKDLARGEAYITMLEAGTQFSLDVQGDIDGIDEMDEEMAVQLVRAAGGAGVTHLQVDKGGRAAQYKVLAYRENRLGEDAHVDAFTLDTAQPVDSTHKQHDMDIILEEPQENLGLSHLPDAVHSMNEPTGEKNDTLSMPDLTSALDSVEAFAAGEDELDEAARSMDEHLDLVLDHVENGSGDHALTEAFIQDHVMQDPVQHNVTQHDVQVPSSQPGTIQCSSDPSSSQSMLVTIGNQELDITVPDGVDPQSFAYSNIVKVKQEDGSERVLLVPVLPNGDLWNEAGIAIDGLLFDC
ncbi:uncharacterized protein LOC111253318 isoform X3 [Varroa destructor]|uniref:Uncharacterized protein n=1 Tax=Varroa destructor TaxID=109461 RepID=A0A7M7MIS8_VARDE|nr:uncharacterized protein LOC111253318 isoform X3 [Varroa destructor]